MIANKKALGEESKLNNTFIIPQYPTDKNILGNMPEIKCLKFTVFLFDLRGGKSRLLTIIILINFKPIFLHIFLR